MSMSIQRGLSPSAQKSVQLAHHLAIARGNSCVEDAHLFMGVLQVEAEEEGMVTALLEISGVTRDEVRLYALSAARDEGKAGGKIPILTTGAQRILGRAREEALAVGSPIVGNEHIFIACIRHQRGPHVGEVLRPLGLDAAKLSAHLRSLNEKPFSRGNPLNDLTQSGQKAIEAAHGAMRASFCGRISTAHLLLGVLDGEENFALDTLRTAGVDIEALKQGVRASIFNDGEIATPQKKFSPAAKRALERAKKEAAHCGHSLIGPHHLVRALLPRPASVSEKLAFGSPIDDPLEKVWSQWPVPEIERQYEKLWLQFTPEAGQTLAKAKQANRAPLSRVKVDQRWALAGALWVYVGFYSLSLFMLGFGLASLLALGGEIRKGYLLRDRSVSFCVGLVIGIFLAIIASIFFPLI
jgi:ATP-dependent Clp protease ATP-binding subunit ClpA